MPAAKLARQQYLPLSRSGDEALTLAPQPRTGWARYWSPGPASEPELLIFVQFAARAGGPDERPPGFEVRSVFFGSSDGSRRVDAALLRAFPHGRMEAAVNRDTVLAAMTRLAAGAGSGPSVPPIPGGGRAPGSNSWWLHRPDPRPNSAPPMQLPPETGRRSDDFYRLLTDAYLWLVSVDEDKPAEAIAAHNNVETNAVFNWLKVARRRGLLRAPTSASPTSRLPERLVITHYVRRQGPSSPASR